MEGRIDSGPIQAHSMFNPRSILSGKLRSPGRFDFAAFSLIERAAIGHLDHLDHS